MIPWPQDIPGAITIVFIVWWAKSFKVAKEVMKEKDNDAGYFFFTLAVSTMLFVGLRAFVAWVWC